jgi:hypothetical protein
MYKIKDIVLEYDDVKIRIFADKDNKNIIYMEYFIVDKWEKILVKWELLKKQFLYYKESLLATLLNYIDNLDNKQLEAQSSTSMSSLSMGKREKIQYLIDVFVKGIGTLFVLSRLAEENKYIRTTFPHDMDLLTRNNLEGLKMSIIMEIKFNFDENKKKIMMKSMDFINRWILFFVEGDYLDKSELLLELITKYLSPRENTETDGPYTNILNRLERIERLVGI